MFKVFLIFSLICFNALAGPFKVGNASGGVIQGDKIYLLDLVESGQELAPDFDFDTENIFLNEVNLSLDPQSFPTSLISQKISEIYKKNKILGIATFQALKRIDWRLINFRLEKTDDLVPTIDINPALIVQLANRRFGQVAIVKEFWQQMPPTHQSALVIHEIFYLMMQTGPSLSEPDATLLARNMVGLVYSPEFKSYSALKFMKATDKLPSISRIKNSLNTLDEWLENKYWANLHYFAATVVFTTAEAKYSPMQNEIIFENGKISNLDDIKNTICHQDRSLSIGIDLYSTEFSFTFNSAFSPPSIAPTLFNKVPFNRDKACKAKDNADVEKYILTTLNSAPNN